MTGKIEKDYWHPGFVGAIELEFINDKEVLAFDREHELSKESLKMDLLIIKKKKDAVIENQIGAIFRQYNIFEFKSPRDGLSIDDYIKTVGYAYLYKGLGKHVDEIPFSELTVTMVRDVMPVGLFNSIRMLGGTVEEKYPGIFYITGVVGIPTQFILTSQLAKETHSSLRLMTEHLQEDDVIRFLQTVIKYQEPGDRNNIDAVLSISSSVNADTFEKVMKRGEAMSDVLLELMKDKIQEKEQQAVDNSLITVIKKVMKKQDWDATKAMEFLEIPPADQVRYVALLSS